MKFIKSKKALVLLGVIAVVGIAAFGAYAFFSSSGNGSGTGKVGTSVDLTVTGGSESTALLPAGPAAALAGGSVVNPASYEQSFDKIVATITGTNQAGCGAANFALSSPTSSWTISGGGLVATIGTTGTPLDTLTANGGAHDTYSMGDLSLAMLETGVNQDACKNATVNISYAVS